MIINRDILLPLAIMVIVMTAPLLLAESGVGPAQLPKNLKAPGISRISPQVLNQARANSQQSFRSEKITPLQTTAIIPEGSLYEHSTIIHHGNHHTIVPHHAVIFTPLAHSKNIITKPQGEFLPWPQFYLKHRKWLMTHQITLQQAGGHTPIRPEVISQFKRINRVVVAIYDNCPISKLQKPISQ